MKRLPRPDAVNRSLLRRRPMPGLASSTAWALALSLTLPATSALSAQAYDALSAGVRDLVRVSAPHVLIENVRLIDGTGAPARAN